MWGLPTRILCRNHLLGAHKEVHTGEWYIQNSVHNKLHGHEARNQFDVGLLVKEHDALVAELLSRGYKHHSPIKDTTPEKSIYI